MRLSDPKNKCCGCAACANACPKSAIEMVQDDCGFLYPKIDESKCVECGLCAKVCDFKKERSKESNIHKAYSLVLKNPKKLYESTSGGAFCAFSDFILESGGAVCGCVMEGDFTVHHIITTEASQRDRMKRSKYVQSDISDVYKPLKTLLEDGRPVLFCGTPCQCAALKSFLRKEYRNLYVIDFLCHGVPNNYLFKEHVLFLENKYGEKINDYTFRDKVFGWNSYNNNVYTNSGMKSCLLNQVYYHFFVRNYSLRPSCFNCSYRSLNRPSDLTIADFWGIEKITKKKNHDGVSLVLEHTEKGSFLMSQVINDKAYVCEIPVQDILYRISTKPARQPVNVEMFWSEYRKNNYEGLFSRFFDYSLKKRIRFEIRKILKKFRLC